MDLDDKVLHYLLAGGGAVLALTLKSGIEYIIAKFWDTEYSQFLKWKKAQQPAAK